MYLKQMLLPVEVMENVLCQFVASGKDWLTFALVCKSWLAVANDKRRWAIKKYDRVVWRLVRKYPTKAWDWQWVSAHPNVTIDLVEANPDLPWNYGGLSDNPNITWDFIKNNLDKDWSWWRIWTRDPLVKHPEDKEYFEVVSSHLCGWIAYHEDLSWNFLLKHREIFETNGGWGEVTFHDCVTQNVIEEYPDLNWHWGNCMSRNPNLTLDFIKRHLDKPWRIYNLAYHHGLQIDDILWLADTLKHTECYSYEGGIHAADEELWSGLSLHPDMTFELVQKFQDKGFTDARISSKHVNVTMEIVKQHPEYDWDFWNMTKNPNLTWDFVSNNLDKDWNWEVLSQLNFVTEKIIEQHLECPWDWDGILFCLSDLSFEFLERHIDKFCVNDE